VDAASIVPATNEKLSLERTFSPIALPVVVKFAVAFLAEPQEIVDRLMKNALVRQMSAFDAISTAANLALVFGSQADGAR
jgi:hypothetical protein